MHILPETTSGEMVPKERLAVWYMNTSDEKWRNARTKDARVATKRLC